MNEMTHNAVPSVDNLPDHNDPIACSDWLRTRYMKSERDADFEDVTPQKNKPDGPSEWTRD